MDVDTLLTANPAQRPAASARQKQEQVAHGLFTFISLLPVGLILALVITLVWRALPILGSRSLDEVLLSEVWKPLSGAFGFLPFISGTVWVTTVAMLISIPPCLLCAIYLAEYASPLARGFSRPLLDMLAAIPSVVYGVWGVLVIVPWVEHSAAPWLAANLGWLPLFQSQNPTGYSLLAGGIVLAVMVAPFMISVIVEVLQAVPDGARQAALALGATRWQAVRSAVLPQALPGILAGIVLGSSRALGETIAVLMVVGNVVQIPGSILDAGYPLPALIANNYGEMLSIPLYDAALLTAALILLVMILLFNILSLLVLRRITRRQA